jgi:hypothetical protein
MHRSASSVESPSRFEERVEHWTHVLLGQMNGTVNYPSDDAGFLAVVNRAKTMCRAIYPESPVAAQPHQAVRADPEPPSAGPYSESHQSASPPSRAGSAPPGRLHLSHTFTEAYKWSKCIVCGITWEAAETARRLYDPNKPQPTVERPRRGDVVMWKCHQWRVISRDGTIVSLIANVPFPVAADDWIKVLVDQVALVENAQPTAVPE